MPTFRLYIVWLILSAGCLLAMALTLGAQFTPPRPTPAVTLPPLLYIRLAGPEGMKVTFYRGAANPISYDAPVVVGVRPGYRYRFAVSNMPGFPEAAFFPTLDVHGSLWLVRNLSHRDFPATIRFQIDDFAQVETGAMVRKAIVLERPETATPIASRPEQPVELTVTPGRELLQEASLHGAVMAVMYLGQRKFAVEELNAAAVPGTLLLPDEKSLPTPRIAPPLPWKCHPVHDPRNGPPHPAQWVALPDGGDVELPAGYGPTGRLHGLDPSDTVAEYTDSLGRKRIVPSNRVALCVPRYILIRSENAPGTQVAQVGPGSTQAAKQGMLVTARQGFVEQSQPVGPEAAVGRLKPSAAVNELGTAVRGRINGLNVVANLAAIDTLDGQCPPPALVAPPHRPLRIIKWPDRHGANIGEVVTFYLRYTNQAAEPITEVVVSDSLTPRFEYVTGSQQSDRVAEFTVQPNEAGSSILRWQFPGALPPGGSGLISFQVRIR